MDLARALAEATKRAEQAEAEVSRLGNRLEGAYLRAERAEAELAALKARRCETCAKWLEVPSPVNSDLRLCDSWSGENAADPPVYTSADVGCSFWVARDEP